MLNISKQGNFINHTAFMYMVIQNNRKKLLKHPLQYEKE